MAEPHEAPGPQPVPRGRAETLGLDRAQLGVTVAPPSAGGGGGGAAGLGGWRCVPLGHTRGPAPALFKGSAGCSQAAGWMPGLARETVPSTPSAGGSTRTRAPRRLGTLWETSCPETGCPFLARVATWAPCRHLRAWWSPPPGWRVRLEGKGGRPAGSCLLSWQRGSRAGGWTAALLVHLQ